MQMAILDINGQSNFAGFRVALHLKELSRCGGSSNCLHDTSTQVCATVFNLKFALALLLADTV
jgi:hypothetical protein